MQNARSQRPRRSATATPGHPASRALRSSLAQVSSSLGSEGPHVPATLDPLLPHSNNSTGNVSAAEQVAAQGARPRRGAVRVRHWEAIFHRSGMESADVHPRPACATIGLLAPDLLGSELAGELTVTASQQRASGVVSAGVGGPLASHEPRLALHARKFCA
jgi:hypothetical protein